MSKSFFDGEDARVARDEGVARVTWNSKEWMPQAIEAFEDHIEFGIPFIAEEMRDILSKWIDQPHSPNAWGALSLVLVRRKQICKTGVHRSMKHVKSHARATPEYIRVS